MREEEKRRRGEEEKIPELRRAKRPYSSWLNRRQCDKILHSYGEETQYGRCARKPNHVGSHTAHEPLATLLDVLGREETIQDLIVLMRAQNPSRPQICRCKECVENLPS